MPAAASSIALRHYVRGRYRDANGSRSHGPGARGRLARGLGDELLGDDQGFDAPRSGAPLPPFWHHLYFWEVAPPEGLGADGHPSTGGRIPDFGLPKRMWAGGRAVWHAPILCGVAAEKRTQIKSTRRVEGRSGPLAFVTLTHQIRQRGALVLTEDQDLVYRQAGAPAAAAPSPPEGAAHAETLRFDATALFRYSALTMNGHRIHYDADFARGTEGYPGLVVHGPLLATHLARIAEARLGPLKRFAFRATAPLFLGEVARFCQRGHDLWVVGPDGRQCMIAEART